MNGRTLALFLPLVSLACGSESRSPRAEASSTTQAPRSDDSGKKATAVVTHPTPSDPRRTAALIPTMMLRFPQDSLPLVADARLKQKGEIGNTAFALMPGGQRLTGEELVEWLVKSPKPLMASPTYTRGAIATWTG